MGTREWTAVRQGEGPPEKLPRARLGLRHPGSGTGRDKPLLLKPLELGPCAPSLSPPEARAPGPCLGAQG